MKALVLGLIAWALPFFAVAETAELVDASDPERIAAILQDEGFKAELTKGENDALIIRSGASGVDFQIAFMACGGETNVCEVLSFSAGFDFEYGKKPSDLSNWNQTKWTKAYLDAENDPFLEHNVNMLHGVSEANFRDTLNWYARELGRFVDFIGWNDPKSAPDIDPEIKPI